MLGEVLGVLRVGEEGYLGDDSGHVGFIAGIEPISSTFAAVIAHHDPARDAVVGHTVIQHIAVHYLSHGIGQLDPSFVAIECTFVGHEPLGRVAVVVQEDHSTGALVQGKVGAEHAYRYAVGVVFGAIDGCGDRGVDVYDSAFLGSCCQLGICRHGAAVADDAGVARFFDDIFDVAGVAVPELCFLDDTVFGIGGACTLASSLRVVVVADIQHYGVGGVGLSLHLLLHTTAKHHEEAEQEGKDDVFHAGNQSGSSAWPEAGIAPIFR